jgi:hypothetical protein
VTPGTTWTTFTVTRQANDDEESATVPVVVLTGRLPELRDALATTAERAWATATRNEWRKARAWYSPGSAEMGAELCGELPTPCGWPVLVLPPVEQPVAYRAIRSVAVPTHTDRRPRAIAELLIKQHFR